MRMLRKKFFHFGLTTKRWASLLSVKEEVREALHEGKPVVALESTIITHGMEFPYNLQTATEVEEAIRQQNAVPATIAVIKGQIKVGLSEVELEELSQKQGTCVKVSRRDFPYVVSQKLSGGLTVSGTMIVAHKMNIPIFVTGGIGGVHREGETTLDVSADLTELGRTSVAVVSSGVKSILDIPKTLEYLETQGVAVASFGSSTDFPAFYCRRSGHKSPYSLNSCVAAAQFIQAAMELNLGSGILIAVPIPEQHSLDEKTMEEAIEKGLREAKSKNVRGKDVTPFLLKRISELTEGKSLNSNMALIKNNASVGGRIAFELAELREKRARTKGDFHFSSSEKILTHPIEKNEVFDVAVVGGTNLDFVVNVQDRNFQPKAVFFTCIDSRMIPTRFTETCVGDMFVVRNAGNVIPHSRYYPDEVTTNEPAALELGCVLNNVRHIIVCGHSDCKAMNLLHSLRNEEYSSQTNRRISPLRAWMCAHASSSLERFLKMEKEGMHQPLVFHAESPLRKFVAYIDPEDKFRIEDKLSQVNTLQQLQNIASYGFLKDRLERHDLHIHALWFDIYTGDIYYFSRCAKQFVEMDGRTVTGKIQQTVGGVARNIADALSKLQTTPCLISAVGGDEFGDFITAQAKRHLSVGGIEKIRNSRTGTCMVLCDSSGECMVVVGDMGLHDEISIRHVDKHAGVIANCRLLVFDGNLHVDTMQHILWLCQAKSVPVWFEPTDLLKASKPFLNKNTPTPSFISPNYLEFKMIFEAVFPEYKNEENLNQVDECIQKGYLLAELIENIIITLGKEGVMVIRKGGKSDPFFCPKGKIIKLATSISHRLYKPISIPANEIVNVSGAGDCFASGFISAMLRGKTEEECIKIGFMCSTASLKCFNPVPESFESKS